MDRIQLKEIYARLSEYDGKTVTVAGWAKTIRDSKAFGFIELNDGSCFKNMQIVFERASLDNYDEIAHENVGAALVVTGKVVATPENKQPCEIKAETVAVEGELPFINSSTSAASSMSIRPSSRAATARARAVCFKSPPSISTGWRKLKI